MWTSASVLGCFGTGWLHLSFVMCFASYCCLRLGLSPLVRFACCWLCSSRFFSSFLQTSIFFSRSPYTCCFLLFFSPLALVAVMLSLFSVFWRRLLQHYFVVVYCSEVRLKHIQRHYSTCVTAGRSATLVFLTENLCFSCHCHTLLPFMCSHDFISLCHARGRPHTLNFAEPPSCWKRPSTKCRYPSFLTWLCTSHLIKPSCRRLEMKHQHVLDLAANHLLDLLHLSFSCQISTVFCTFHL